jgi:hypothetical protein
VFDGEQPIEDVAGWQRRFAYGNRVQVERLLVKPLPFRFGFNVIGNDEIGDEIGEPLDRKIQRRPSIAKV